MIRVLAAAVMVVAAFSANAETLRMAVTTSFNNSGLADIMLPAIKQDIGLDIHLLVVGTGQALRMGRAGDVDAVLVHSPPAEEAFVADGFATHRREIMYNDFVLLGPVDDSASVSDAATAAEALSRIAAVAAIFVSRGDDSGTHRKEQLLWRLAGLEPQGFGAWYRSIGAGMGAALNTASAMRAYVLSDRASWLNFQRETGLAVLFSGDPALFNQYSYLPINPEVHPHLRADAARRLERWLVSSRARDLIDGYRLGGERLFKHNAKVR